MQDEFMRLQTMLQKTIVFITHDFLEALRLADRMAIMKDGEIVQIGTPSDVVLNPADDYVAEFTSDVPLVRVITVDDLIEPYAGSLGTAEVVETGMSLHEVLPCFAERPEGFAITDKNGNIIGQITAAKVLATLASGEDRTVAPVS
jgi:glycine betaine/proline transport system ATP-binding protein